MHNDKDLGNKKWNNQQSATPSEQKLNEGFSGENIPPGYDPSDESISQRMTSETEIDQFGNHTEVKRARFPHDRDENIGFDNDNSEIENQKSLENRDRNYDTEPDRYPESHPENHRDRGNYHPGDKP